MPTPSQTTSAHLPSPSKLHRPELLAPAGNWDCAKAAIENGADAIYFGLERFNARMRAQNFTEGDLPALIEFLHRRGVKGYVTLNTLIFPKELPDAEQYLRAIITAGVDAVIVQDVGICRLIRHLSPDFPIHASTQMTITSTTGVEFAKALGCQLVVLARECSLKEINKIQQQLVDRQSLPLEVFVHGALCVAYSGQCLTSEALGGRSANRGECAQACRMPYNLIADGKVVELGDRRYLLSPQDLSGLEVLPDLIQAGVHCLKIEGRLKSPEYVANVVRVYRQAIDRVLAHIPVSLDRDQPDCNNPNCDQPNYNHSNYNHSNCDNPDRYNLEMAFSRGLYTGWFRGINNQELVHARFGKKRGVYLGEVKRIQQEQITVRLQTPVKPGDGVVFDNGHPEIKEAGGRIFTVETHGKDTILTFGRGHLETKKIRIGDKIWKTSDPELDRQLRQTYAGETPQFQQSIDVAIHGELHQPLTVIARDQQGHLVQVESAMPLVAAHTKPLTIDRLRDQFSRLGNTPFRLGNLTADLNGSLMLPISELNRLRREVVAQLEIQRIQPKRWQLHPNAALSSLLPNPHATIDPSTPPTLTVLVRTLPQLQAALTAGIQTLYCELEDPRQYREAVNVVKAYRDQTLEIGGEGENKPAALPPQIVVAPPRITKPNENWILQQVRSSDADGYLIRNYDQLQYFQHDRCIGDFSLNVANPLTADYLKREFNLERLTASYDLNADQLQDLITACPSDWFEITIHQHMPMFHMEHCVFCAFLSEGTDFTNCGRPCESYEVKLRDRTGTEHLLQADAGCRNTVFNGVAQTGAKYVQRLMEIGANQFRIEFVNETPEQVSQTIDCYRQLLNHEITGSQLWRTLKLQSQLGVTRGTMNVS